MSTSLFLLPLLAACSADPVEVPPESPAEAQVLGRCLYTNPFSQQTECKEYVGAAWTVPDAEGDCAAPVPGGAPGAFEADLACARDTYIGECVVDGGGDLQTTTVFFGDDPGACGGAELGCSFSSGEFVPSDVCLEDEPAGIPPENAFVPFQQICADPLPGEPAGLGPNGQVCTWEAVSGATEEGRRFEDYASCATVRTQRPYYAYDVTSDTDPDDPRLDDPVWLEEAAWVTAQVEASSCTCCHSAELAPQGPSGWYLEAEPIWLDTVDDDGLAMLAGWVDSTAFGAFPPEENNGFDRSTTGLPTTDVPRMVAFLEGELARRGLAPADFADTEPFGGVLYDQLFYEPALCSDGQGVDADGTVSWTGGAARYLYVLEPDSMSPGVPPNLDLPDGTLWRLDVGHTEQPLASGVQYGAAPAGTRTAFPATGAPPPLVSGQTYYLVALLDIYQPATRCLFVAP